MPIDELPLQAEGEAAASTLNEGLKSCRTVVADYRAKLAGELVAAMQPIDDEGPARSAGGDPPG